MNSELRHQVAEIAYHLPHASWWFVKRCELFHRRHHVWSSDTDPELGVTVAVAFCSKCNLIVGFDSQEGAS